MAAIAFRGLRYLVLGEAGEDPGSAVSGDTDGIAAVSQKTITIT